MTTSPNPVPIQNNILAALPREQYERLQRHLTKIDLPQGRILYHQGAQIEHVYFPNAGMVSLVTVMEDGASVEVGVVGQSGMVGVQIVLGDDIAPSQAIVQIAGSGLQLSAKVLQDEVNIGGEFQALLHRFIVAHLKQTAQTAACNRNHTINERLAYWLLTCRETVGGNRLKLTQEFIAQMLGVRRAGVGDAAISLQGLGLIKYTRGDIEILDQVGLEKFSCECYRVVSQEFKRLLGSLSKSPSINYATD